jgi:hypothetical protein
MIGCPSCKRRSFSHVEMLAASLDGALQCPACGELARLDTMSRCVVACLLAIVLSILLLYGNIFYSGYLFAISTIFVLAGWRVLCAMLLPIMSLEKSPESTRFDRRQNMVTLAILIFAAIAFDGFMTSPTDADRARMNAASPNVSASSK